MPADGCELFCEQGNHGGGWRGALLQCGRGSHSREQSDGILEQDAQRVHYRRGSRGQDMLLYQKLNAFALILFGV